LDFIYTKIENASDYESGGYHAEMCGAPSHCHACMKDRMIRSSLVVGLWQQISTLSTTIDNISDE
jgi:hypothetical protein